MGIRFARICFGHNNQTCVEKFGKIAAKGPKTECTSVHGNGKKVTPTADCGPANLLGAKGPKHFACLGPTHGGTVAVAEQIPDIFEPQSVDKLLFRGPSRNSGIEGAGKTDVIRVGSRKVKLVPTTSPKDPESILKVLNSGDAGVAPGYADRKVKPGENGAIGLLYTQFCEKRFQPTDRLRRSRIPKAAGARSRSRHPPF